MTKSNKKYQLEKNLWTDNDFDLMGWHDNPIYAIKFGANYELIMDIDYYFKWVLKGKKYFFWISPCTLVFENVYGLNIEVDSVSLELLIDTIIKENPKKPKNSEFIKREIEFDWTLELHTGAISFTSVGFKQYVRQQPQFARNFGLKERGGISFETTLV